MAHLSGSCNFNVSFWYLIKKKKTLCLKGLSNCCSAKPIYYFMQGMFQMLLNSGISFTSYHRTTAGSFNKAPNP